MVDSTVLSRFLDARMRLLFLVVLYYIVFPAKAQVACEQLDSVIKSLDLKEVTVTAKKVRQQGDTISYMASSYIKKNDKVLEDLLKKMPGIEVTTDGQVKYNGQWINEFYIEGTDMIGDNYSVATKNMDAQAIGFVQIMENHQDRKILQNTQRGTAPAMNIRLKQTAKGVWSSTLSGALGAQPSFSHDISLTLMNFQHKLQNISVLKTNNVGTALCREVHATDNSSLLLSMGILTPSKPSLPDMYVYDNESYSASGNQLLKLNNENTLTFNISYLYDKEKQTANDVTTYFTGGEAVKTVKELNNASLCQHYLGGHVVYKKNAATTYIKNNLSFDFSFPVNTGVINDYVLQKLSGHYICIDNNLIANYKRKGGGIADGNLQINYTDKTGNLVVESENLQEKIHQHNFKLNGATSFVAVRVPHLIFNLNGEVKTEWNKATMTFPNMAYSECGKISTWLLGTSVIPKFFLHINNKLQWLVYVPLGIKYYYSDDDAVTAYNKMMFMAEPYSNLTYKPDERLSFDLTTIYREDLPGTLSLMAQKRYTNYRSTVANPDSIKVWRNRTIRTALTMNYKDVLHMLFCNLTLSYAYMHNGSSLDYEFTEGSVVNYITSALPTNNEVWQVGQTFSKGFFRWNAKVSENLTLGTANTGYYLSQTLHKGRNDFLQGSLSFTAQPARWFAFSTNNDGMLTKVYTDGKANGTEYFTFASKTSLNIWPFKEVCITPSLQYNYNNYFDEGRDNVFLNSSAEYYLKSTTFFVRCNNLLDNRCFCRVTDNGVMRYVSEYSLRGRTLMIGIRIKLT